MAIASVENGRVQSNNKQYQPGIDNLLLDSSNGVEWLEWVNSFRYEPTGTSKPYTARKEVSGYWYGYRKISGRLHKKYIGKSSEINTAKLEEIAEALNIPPQPRVTEVTDKVTDKVTNDRLTALELQVQALQESLEALREELRGKLESGDSSELPKVDNAVAQQLQNELGNLKAENENLKADCTQLLESSTVVANKLREEVQKLRSQLEQERADREEVEAQLADREKEIAELRSQLATQGERTPQHQLYSQIEELKERNRLLLIKSREERQKLEEKISALEYRDKSQSRRLEEKQARLDELEEQFEGELSDLRQKSATASRDLPEAADLLNRLRAKRKNLKMDLVDMKVLLEILES